METEAFSTLIEKIRNKEILLPDFQRNFVWKDSERQARLIASVLSKMPVGSILLLKNKASDYAYKQIGCKNRKTYSELSLKEDSEILALLDGQQRITVLTTAFSDEVFNLAGGAKYLISPNLKRRFFLRLPKRNSDNASSNDYFGVTKLLFPLSNPDTDEPEFLADDIYEITKVVDFNASDDSCLNPFAKTAHSKNELINYCVTGPDYLIPLFLLTGNNDAWLQKILDRIYQDVINDILQEYAAVDCNKIDYINKILSKETIDLSENPDNIADPKEFEKELKNQGNVWSAQMRSYLSSCLSKMQLSQIIVDNHRRNRAINIYENLNKGGVQLGLFELIMARFASISNQNYYDVLVSNIQKEYSPYPKYMYSPALKNKPDIYNYINSKNYNVAKVFECINSKNDDISPIYINAYLNVLSLYTYVPDFDIKKILSKSGNGVSLIKKNCILKIPAEALRDNCEKVCEALDKALFFLQMRCGVRSLDQINYDLMLTVIAYVIMSSDSPITYDYLEAWYWGSIFSGHFNSDQTDKTIKSIIFLLDAIQNGNTDGIKSICDTIFKSPDFSSKDFLLMSNSTTTLVHPKEFLTDKVCQFYLAQCYSTLFDSSVTLTPFTEKKLEKHHVIPLGAYLKTHPDCGKKTEDLRKDNYFFLNSPLNFVYITSEDNNAISDEDLSNYQNRINSYSTRLTLGFTASFDILSGNNYETILSTRFDNFAGAVENRIKNLIP